MNKIPITLALATTTKGHWSIKTRWVETLNSFNQAFPLSQYAARVAHIKVSPGEDELAAQMTKELESRGFKVLATQGSWFHGTPDHQTNYLADALKIIENVNTPYVFFVEDDWRVGVYDGQFIDHIQHAISLLEQDGRCMQVRIPRYSNEMRRIQGLQAKHSLNRWAEPIDDNTFWHDDFSMNPSFYRTRDLRAGLVLTQISALPKHIEEGLGQALRLLANRQPEQHNHFACLNADKIRIAHIGTKPGEEDPLDKPLIAT